LGHFIVNTF